jgi:hypothetical protein
LKSRGAAILRLLVVYVASLFAGLAELIDLLPDKFHPQETFIVHHDLQVSAFLVHVETVLTVLDEIWQLIFGDLQEIEECLIFPDLCIGQDGRYNKADENDHDY